MLYSLRAEGCPRLALGLLEQEILQTGRRGAVAVASEESADLRPAFEALGIPMVSLEWRPRDFAGLAWRARKALTALRPRGVICYTVGLHVPIALAARTLGVPIVLHLGNAPPASDRRARFKIQLQMLVGRPFVGSYAACSEHVRREAVRAYRLPARLVVTVPNGISVEEFLGRRGARGAGSNGGPLRVGMVGSLEVHKAQDTLIDAVALLARRGVDVRLRLIGAGSREASLRRRAQQLRVADRVEWAGVVANVAAELEKLDVFTYSVREEEGLGIALVEALAAGCPAVASDVGACREVLDGGRLGLLVPGQGADAWADAIVAARSLPPPPPDALSRYDIRQTAWAYDGLLGRGQ